MDKLQWKLYQQKKSQRQLMPLTSASCRTANQEKQINKVCCAKQSFWKENIFQWGSPGRTGQEREELHSVCFANSSCAILWPCNHWAPQPLLHRAPGITPKIQNYTEILIRFSHTRAKTNPKSQQWEQQGKFWAPEPELNMNYLSGECC